MLDVLDHGMGHKLQWNVKHRYTKLELGFPGQNHVLQGSLYAAA